MKTKFLLFLLGLYLSVPVKTQTLFTYGNHKVDVSEFLKAFGKNNINPATPKAEALREYLDLYIRSKLKIQEAYERGYDTLPHLKEEMANLREQILPNYLQNPEQLNRLVQEAFQRSQKDIRAAHIFVSFLNPQGRYDSVAAEKKLQNILSRLRKGEDFARVARTFSDDTVSGKQGGDLGFITVFTLPYAFENAIYGTRPGNISSPVKSKAGYHIFKNLGERKAVGKIKLQQILLVFPPGADDHVKKQIALRADSLYKRILAGDNFSRLASEFSNDYVTAASGGVMQEMSVGEFDPAFEARVRLLKKDGEVTKPFLTSHGWHIVKRLSVKPVITDPNNREYRDELRQKILADPYRNKNDEYIIEVVKQKKGFSILPYSEEALWNMSDSVLDGKPMTSGWAITAFTPLFRVGDSVYDANDWVNYAYLYRYKEDGSGIKPWPEVRENWHRHLILQYYKDHLEDFNEEFKRQIDDFRDGNLFFEIMQREVWNRSMTDTAELKTVYEKNKEKYIWKQSADAVIFYCSDLNTAKTVYERLKKNPSAWKLLPDEFPEKVLFDSSRYEWNQIPGLKGKPYARQITEPEINKNDNTASLAYIFKIHEKPTPRSFAEAKGMVINDYQALLEKELDEKLRKKFPVTINQDVLAKMLK
ncbi:MAG: peptidylprolyl isomerase [Chitinophagaceae bacterium]|nr:peptidylprolyl isomerase [Chitinophagaceae bacterium]